MRCVFKAAPVLLALYCYLSFSVAIVYWCQGKVSDSVLSRASIVMQSLFRLNFQFNLWMCWCCLDHLFLKLYVLTSIIVYAQCMMIWFVIAWTRTVEIGCWTERSTILLFEFCVLRVGIERSTLCSSWSALSSLFHLSSDSSYCFLFNSLDPLDLDSVFTSLLLIFEVWTVKIVKRHLEWEFAFS